MRGAPEGRWKGRPSATHRRNYLCILCGRMPRVSVVYDQGAPRGPLCCGRAMRMLSYEQTVVATRLTPATRSKWIAGGGAVEKAAGRRRWRMSRRRV
jgi:hypothetical protein